MVFGISYREELEEGVGDHVSAASTLATEHSGKLSPGRTFSIGRLLHTGAYYLGCMW